MDDTRLKVMEAIARRRHVTAQYNGTRMTLAPHQMFERHGALFVSALNLDKNWRSEEERRLGHFKLDGLGAAMLGISPQSVESHERFMQEESLNVPLLACGTRGVCAPATGWRTSA